VIGYTDLHPSVRARLDRVFERLEEQDLLIKDLQTVLGKVKGMDWEGLMAKIDAKLDSMQGTIDSTNEYS
jgi:predicted choloylglycine hydrolase